MITLTREEAQQVLDALSHSHAREPIWKTPLNTAIETLRARLAQPEPEPVAWMQNDMEHFSLWPDEWHVVPLYPAPPQRKEWQGLTDAEVAQIWLTVLNFKEYYRAIEAKLKEKNA
jgi:hypothetical protein